MTAPVLGLSKEPVLSLSKDEILLPPPALGRILPAMRMGLAVAALTAFSACVPPPTGGGTYPSRYPSARGGEYDQEYQHLRSRADLHAEDQRRRVERVGERLLAAIPDHPKVQFVIAANDPSINAGATFGQVAVTGGLLKFIENDDEMAMVLGHELAHITEGHVTKGMLSGVALNVLAVVLEAKAPGAGQLAGGVGQLFLNHFTQDQERVADTVGQGYAYAAGYDPRAAVEVQERLGVEAPQTLSAGYFDSHPSSGERAVNARRRAEELLAQGPPPGRDEALAAAGEGRRGRSRGRVARASDRDRDPDYEVVPADEERDVRPSSYRPEPALRAARSDGLSEDCRRARNYEERAANATSEAERRELHGRALRYCPALAESHEGPTSEY